MSSVQISGNASGAGVLTIAAPNTASNFTLTLPTATTTLVGTDATQTLTNKTLGSGLVAGASYLTSGTAQASTSGTSIDFTGIPSWVKRITVMFNGVSTSGLSLVVVQLGTSSGFVSTGYLGAAYASTYSSITTGLATSSNSSASDTRHGSMLITLVGSNTYVSQAVIGVSNAASGGFGGSSIALAGTLDRVRITTVNGTDTFDAGSINILYE